MRPVENIVLNMSAGLLPEDLSIAKQIVEAHNFPIGD